MNRTLKRVLGLSGSVVLGLAGAVTFASAAQAHHADYWGTSACNDDGTWTVTWEATDGTWPGKDANLTAAVQSWTVDGEVSGPLFAEGAPLPAHGSTETLKGTQVVSGDVPAVSLALDVKWSNKKEEPGQPYMVSQPDGGCDAPEEDPEPGFTIDSEVDCVGIWVEADNTNPEALAEFTFVSSDGEEESYTPEAGEGFSWYFLLEDAEAGLSVDVLVDGDLVETIEWYNKDLCSYIAVEADCEGLNVALSVPENGEETVFQLWTSLSDEPTEVVLTAGQSESFSFKAEGDEELWVDYYIEVPKDATQGGVYWIPCDEETPSPSGTPSAQPQLPTTGSSMTIMIGSAAALIVAAAAIFLIMRRRRAAQDW